MKRLHETPTLPGPRRPPLCFSAGTSGANHCKCRAADILFVHTEGYPAGECFGASFVGLPLPPTSPSQPFDALESDIDLVAGSFTTANRNALTALGVNSAPTPAATAVPVSPDQAEPAKPARKAAAGGRSAKSLRSGPASSTARSTKRPARGKPSAPAPAPAPVQEAAPRKSLASSRGPARRVSTAPRRRK